MIHRAKFQNFKALKDVEVTFDERLTVLVGPNGSGKSSVLRGIYWLCEFCGNARQFEKGVAEILRDIQSTCVSKSEPQLFEMADIVDGHRSGIRFRAHPEFDKTFTMKISDAELPERWECTAISQKGETHRYPSREPRIKEQLDVSFIPAELIQLHSGKLAAPSLTETTPPPMKSDGSGLASLMGYFKFYDEPRFNQVVELFRRVIPHIQHIRLDRVPAGPTGALGEGLVFDLPGRKGTPASAMSDGTLYALGLIVKILDPQRPKTLLIDDIDHGFHPKAQVTLVELLHKLLDEIPDLQIIATSHSPYILSGLKWEEVRVTALRDDGSAVIRPLTAHPKYEKNKQAMSPGEFWSYAGEDWILRLPEVEAVGR